jgi:uncharacterized protein YyaL (SSP411 family)
MLLTINTLFAKDNALIHETSPYLQRHAHNPVNWYAWSEKTLEIAKKQNKPIFLSIGYSTCHWCHVMEEESFEHQDVADILNQYFISIKVDKEEFPHIDKKYQNLFRAFKGRRGGWPLSVFLTPNLEPFFITTYMPRGSYGGVENITTLTNRLGKLYNDKKKLNNELQKFKKAKEEMNQAPQPTKERMELKSLVKITMEKIEKQYDKENSGFSLANTKFPEPSKIELLLNIYKTTGDSRAFDMAKETLLTMSKRGIYDQIDGGFFRYSDKKWQIPHFQKLLYVNAQMPLPYLEMYRLTDDKYFYNIAKATVDEMEKNYVENGLYISASDSVGKDGIEGLYFTYMYDNLIIDLKKEGLSEEEVEEVLEYLNIEELGNLDGELAHVNIMEDEVPNKIEIVKSYLRKLRTKRSFPFLDKKIITSWNAMMIKTLYTMGQYEPTYIKIANSRLKSLLALMLKDNILYHQTIGERTATQKAQLEDYAYLVDTLLTAHQVTLDKKYLKLASKLAHNAKELFNQKNVWYMSRQMPKVKADFDDKYYSSPLSILLNSFLTLANVHDDLDLGEESKKIVKNYGRILEESPEESSSFVTLAMRLKVGVVTLKAKKEVLKKYQKEFLNMEYPFILRKAHSYDEYMACKLGLCFATAKSFKNINISIINAKKEIKVKPEKIIWGNSK